MGYGTRFKLTTQNCDTETENQIHYFMENDEDYYYGVLSEEPAKWYDHEKEMKKLSLKFPNVLFRLDGEGEAQGDLWVKYFKNGKMQKCVAQLVLDDTFDESKLE